MMKFYNIMYFCATFESLDPFTEFTRGIIDDTRAKLFIYKKFWYILHVFLSYVSFTWFQHHV